MIDNSTFGTLKAMFHTFGCKLNFAETSTVARAFADEGIVRAGEGETPDIIVVNTCSVTELADKKCRQTIRSFHRRYPQADILVTGCYAQLKPAEVAEIEGVAIVAGNDRKWELTAFLRKWIAEHTPQNHITPAKDIRTFTPSCSRGDRTRYFLKVQDGCDYGCTYCTIPIGDFGKRSVPETGRKENFLDLIRQLDRVDGIERYRISSIEPNLLTDEIIEFCAGSRAFMPHFHIPLQCGSDAVLQLMHRHYDTALFREKIARIKELMPHAFIGVDLIVGARGETDNEFLRSAEFVESLPISRLHIFPYSERPGTKALEISHTVSQEEKHRRVNTMLKISERKMHDFASSFLGTSRPVLLEHSREGEPMGGFTDNYLRVEINAPQHLDNHIVNARLLSIIPTEMGDSHIRAELDVNP